jgi:hypothetical protein
MPSSPDILGHGWSLRCVSEEHLGFQVIGAASERTQQKLRYPGLPDGIRNVAIDRPKLQGKELWNPDHRDWDKSTCPSPLGSTQHAN